MKFWCGKNTHFWEFSEGNENIFHHFISVIIGSVCFWQENFCREKTFHSFSVCCCAIWKPQKNGEMRIFKMKMSVCMKMEWSVATNYKIKLKWVYLKKYFSCCCCSFLPFFFAFVVLPELTTRYTKHECIWVKWN